MTEPATRAVYPDIEPYEHGRLDVGDGNHGGSDRLLSAIVGATDSFAATGEGHD